MKIKSSIKTLDVEFPNGKKKTYNFNVGDKDKLGEWYDKAKELEALGTQNEDFSRDQMELLHSVERDLLTMVLGARSWREIYKGCEKSIFSVFPVVQEMSRLVKVGLEDFTKDIGKDAGK